jgi:hypothetical protein
MQGYSSTNVIERRSGMIKMNPATKEGYDKYIKNHNDYQIPYDNTDFRKLSAYRENHHYVRPDPSNIKHGPWWLHGVPVVPYKLILSEQPATNLIDPIDVELKDINKNQGRYYGQTLGNTNVISRGIAKYADHQSFNLIHDVKPLQRSLIRKLIEERKNNLPNFRPEATMSRETHAKFIKKNKTMLHKKMDKKTAYKN